MHLALFFSPMGRSVWAWRRPTSRVEDLWGLELPSRTAQQAEAAKFDAVFMADNFQVPDVSLPHMVGYEPLTLTAALAARTEKIGFIATASTTFVPPHTVARTFSGLDHLSGGRVAWNVVTSADGEEHFGVELPPTEERYRRAHEYVEVVKSLWDCWADDAVVADKERGVWADPDRVRRADFHGEYFDVQGPLTTNRSPQGHPVLAQAGQSAAGVDFASAHAEVVFTVQPELDGAKTFYESIKAQAAARGRSSDELKVLPGIVPIVGHDEEHARRIAAELDGLVELEHGRKGLTEGLLGADLRGLSFDEPIPLDRLTPPDELTGGSIYASRYINLYRTVEAQRTTLREMIVARARSVGHGSLVGTAEQVADRMEEWFTDGACDGFVLSPPYMPEGLDLVCSELVPELQRRGLFRKDYEGDTLRDHLGLARPPAR
ncbi:MAG: hypothetical protein ABS81_09740 [Pseudonocardia sp. SCN 72-86]|nr:MAG: hypothetical protein ABS81_09740 [Pseudonocardia sp. SCN 72-86]